MRYGAPCFQSCGPSGCFSEASGTTVALTVSVALCSLEVTEVAIPAVGGAMLK